MVWNDLTSCQTTRCTCTHSQTPSASFSTRAAASRIESGSRWLKTPRNQDASNPVTSSSNPRLAILVNAGVVLESGFHCKYYVHAQHVQLPDAYVIDVTIMLFFTRKVLAWRWHPLSKVIAASSSCQRRWAWRKYACTLLVWTTLVILVLIEKIHDSMINTYLFYQFLIC